MLVPAPVDVRERAGSFLLHPGTLVRGPDELAACVRQELSQATGYAFPSGEGTDGSVAVELDPALGAEAYRLVVTAELVRIVGGSAAGVFYGVQTLRQLLPPDAYRRGPLPGARWEAPCIEIEDAPRFGWRGAHLDVGRHYMPKPFLFRFVDLLAMHKLNVLHLHLTEDQGWRFESLRYPRLTEVGAVRAETLLPGQESGDGIPHGGYYTQDDLRELVAYAKARHITVLPEIELPGHAQAAIAAYPELGNDPDKRLPVRTEWGIAENVLNPEESTLGFFQDVFAEVLDVFPGEYVHVGGDECPKTQWRRSARARALMKERGLADADALQSWFIHRMADWLADRGRRLVGWDEILEGGLAPGATVMSWRGKSGGVTAARAGHDVVMAPSSHTYFDHYQSDELGEPYAIGGHLPLSKVYAYEPVPGKLTATEAAHVLGTQFQLWTEYMPDPQRVEYMAFPRACAFAEVAWSPPEARSYDSFLDRLPHHLRRLDAAGVGYRPLAGPHPWQRVGGG